METQVHLETETKASVGKGLINNGSQVEGRKTKLFHVQLGIEPPPPGRQWARGQDLSGERGRCWPLAMPRNSESSGRSTGLYRYCGNTA